MELDDKQMAEQWISISTTEAWALIVEKLNESRESYYNDLKRPGTDTTEDNFYKGCIYVIERILNMPQAAQELLEAPPETEEG